MEQPCFLASCKKRISSVYHCLNQDTYCCSHHLRNHTKQVDEHHYANLRKKLTWEESKELSVKAIQGLKSLKSLKRIIRNITLQFIDQVNSAAHQTLQKVKDVEHGISNFFTILSLEKSINKVQYQWINELKFPDKPNEFKSYKHFSKLFNADLVIFGFGDWRECSEIVFSCDQTNGGLWSIDLETLQKVSWDYAPKIGTFSTVCKLDKENYFFFGGYKGGVVNDTVIVNTKKKTF